MTEIASAATPQLGSLFRWSFDRAAGARLNILQQPLPEQGRSQKNHPVASREHLGYALSFQIVSDGHSDHSSTDAGDAQIPIAHGSG